MNEKSSQLHRDDAVYPKDDFDEIELLERLGGDTAFFLELIETFLEDVPKQLEKMVLASSEGDISAINEIAHSLKSAGGAVCAYTFRKTAADLESTAKFGTITDVLPIVQKLEQNFQQLRTVMIREGVPQ